MIRVILAPAVASLLLAGCGAPAGDGMQTALSPAPDDITAPDTSPSMVWLPTGTRFDVRLDDPLGSETSRDGDTFGMTTLDDVIVEDFTAIPAGSRVTGSVLEAAKAPRGAGNARLTLAFGRLVLPDGRSIEIVGSLSDHLGSAKEHDEAIAGSDTVDRTLIGRILGRDTRGAIGGGREADAPGTAVVVSREGEPVVLPKGTVLTIDLEKPVRVQLPPAGTERGQTS